MQGVVSVFMNRDWGFSTEYKNFSNVNMMFKYYPYEKQQNITLLDWKVLSFERRTLKVFLNFSDPIFVSQYSVRNLLLILLGKR